MKPNRPLDAASSPAPMAKVCRSRHVRAVAVRVLSVTAVAAATCTLWAGAASAATTHVAAKHNTTTAITNANPGHTDVGKPFTFHITVTSTGGSAASGTAKVKPTSPGGLPSSYSCTATISGGAGSCTITPPDYGIVDYAATYSGDATHNGSKSGSFTLAVQNVTKTSVSPAKAAAGSVKLHADVYAMGADIDHAQGGAGSVAFYIATSPTGTPTVIKGCAAELLLTFTGPPDFYNVATCTDTLHAGTYYVTAVFSGDDTNKGSTSPVHKLVVS